MQTRTSYPIIPGKVNKFRDGTLELDVGGVTAEKERSLYTFADLGGVTNYAVHGSDLQTTAHAVVERVFLCKGEGGALVAPPRAPRLGNDKKLRDRFRELGDTVKAGPPATPRQFLGYYRGRRLRVYERAVASLELRPLEAQDAYISAFVKAEKIDGDKVPSVPRLIQPRSARYGAALGEYLKPREHCVYASINEINGATVVCKGQNAVERAKTLRHAWESLRDPVAVFLDVSRFDQHVSVEALKLEHEVYKRIYRGDEYLEWLLSLQLVNRGFYRSGNMKLKYCVRGRRMSGDMNTAMGNVILMCTMMRHWIDTCGVAATFADDGDDCCLFVERSDLDKVVGGVCPIVPFFLEMGFTLKVDGHTDVFERIEFCQSHPVYDGTRWIMVRGLSCLDKDRHSVLPLRNEREWQKHRGSVAACGLALAGNMPVFGEFYLALGRGTDFGRSDELETGMDYLARGLTGGFVPPAPEARVSFWLAFGILPDEQLALEAFYRSVEVAYPASPVEVVMKSSPQVPYPVEELRRDRS